MIDFNCLPNCHALYNLAGKIQVLHVILERERVFLFLFLEHKMSHNFVVKNNVR